MAASRTLRLGSVRQLTSSGTAALAGARILLKARTAYSRTDGSELVAAPKSDGVADAAAGPIAAIAYRALVCDEGEIPCSTMLTKSGTAPLASEPKMSNAAAAS